MSKKETKVTTFVADDRTTDASTLDVDRIYEEEDRVVETGGYLALDEQQEFSEPTLGVHRVVIQEWLNQPETWIHPATSNWSPDEEIHYDPHLELHLRDDTCGALYKKRVFATGLQSLAKNLNRQAHGVLTGTPVSERLDHFKANELTIWVTYSDEYGVVINFYDAEAYRASRKR